nr:O-antigen ligase family protein [Alteripontixanthobacter muriae]
MQLVPLPPSLWAELPGRELLVKTAEVAGEPQPWRPISISPSATVNALGSLIVPSVTLLLAASLTREQHWKILGVLLVLVAFGALLGLLQFAGGRFDNPLTNDIRTSVSGNFANRNHFALFLAIGSVLVCGWAFHGERVIRLKIFLAVGALLSFLLIILATGSRTGLLLGAVAIVLGIALVLPKAKRTLYELPRSLSIGIVLGIVVIIVTTLALSVTLDRAASVDRASIMDATEDLRYKVLPVVFQEIVRYFPVGSGFGAFDPVYRINEPDKLLMPLYFNRVHNDWLEVALDAGLAGALLLVVAVSWWALASARAWFSSDPTRILTRVASLIIFLIMIASIFDYPARTPMIMAVLALAAAWLADGKSELLERPA